MLIFINYLCVTTVQFRIMYESYCKLRVYSFIHVYVRIGYANITKKKKNIIWSKIITNLMLCNNQYNFIVQYKNQNYFYMLLIKYYETDLDKINIFFMKKCYNFFLYGNQF